MGRGQLKKFLRYLQDFLFPRDVACALCMEEINGDAVCGLCETCAENIGRTRNPVADFKFLSVYSACEYGEEARRLILMMKEGKKPYLGETIAGYIEKVCEENSLSFDEIAYVPTSPENKRRRDYDHMEIAANRLGEKLGLPVTENLRRKEGAKDQTDVPFEERYENVKNSFVYEGKDLSGKRILLIDDVVTSGGTLTACAMTLLDGHAAEVVCATFARAHTAAKFVRKI